MRHRAVSLRQHGFLVYNVVYDTTVSLGLQVAPKLRQDRKDVNQSIVRTDINNVSERIEEFILHTNIMLNTTNHFYL